VAEWFTREGVNFKDAGYHPCGCMVGTICPHRHAGLYCNGQILSDGQWIKCPVCSPVPQPAEQK